MATFPADFWRRLRIDDTQAIESELDSSITERAGTIRDTGVTARSAASESRFRLRGRSLEVSVDGRPYAAVATQGVFAVRDYEGGFADGATNNSNAIDAVLAAAAAFYVSTGIPPTILFHQGTGAYLYDRPHFVSERISLVGECKDIKFQPITSPYSVHCHPFLPAPPLEGSYPYGPEANGSYVPSLVGTGDALHTFNGLSGAAQDNNFIFDISQATAGRLPDNGHPWTIKVKRKFDTLVEYEGIFAIAGSVSSGSQPMLYIFWNNSGVKLSFRYDGKAYDVTCAFTGQPAPSLAINTLYEFELTWDGFTQMRMFLNGEPWTLGAWTPGPGAGVVITGSSDGSGMVQYLDESIQIGCGFAADAFSTDITNSYQKGTWDVFHLSDSVRHTSAYTPSTTKDVADGHTRVLINFTERYRGCLVADGMLGLHKTYYYPGIRTLTEIPEVKMKNLYFFTGLGLIGTFTSFLEFDTVRFQLVEDGVQFQGNGYFSEIRNLNVLAGRMGLNCGSGSYWKLGQVVLEGAVGLKVNGGNIFGVNVNVTARGGARCGLRSSLGTIEFIGFNIDAESATTAPWAGAVLASDMVSLKLSSPTLYNPTNKRTTDPIVYLERTAGGAVNWSAVIDTPGFIPSSGAPLIKTIGTETYWPRPVIMRSPVMLDGSTPTICNIPTNVVDPDALAAVIRFGTAAPTVGTWARGSIVINTAGSAGGWAGWYCVTGGTPGTWKRWGAIEA